ncbi:tryptophan--tRNA ligase [Tepidibacter formicigenes]|jgi:tryptophanyl-tRNA synthetase|uniref:Tryptophan--tRNA ligase n=1 Tax=Tepidibacter formicigenes DSM 15518 TaxID=1123349 RepID=A0A1M6KF46_9FIRM|nr:tryptophan--tRNA ligase [Tepidibacter formicigenes]SHJ57544.1 tryptophanyl-tRNA synthetase [Tepidibacter formicigenes DSM 15518]
MSEKKVILSGVQPSGKLTLGNYIGAINNWVSLQEEYDCYYFIADLHAITVPQEAKNLRKNSIEAIAQYIASGLDPDKNTIFMQSHVSAHAELAWVLNSITYMGELNRMTQFKDKSKKNEANLNSALFTYPTLMAADILLYQADFVPVGEDQKQHLELARNLAQRFNKRYSETFKVPKPYIAKVGARVMSLQEPTKKMSKSDENENAYIGMVEEPDSILRKVKRAVTDSVGIVKYSDEQPGIKNLIDIYSKLSGKTTEEIEVMYEGKGYGEFKNDVAEVIIESLRPVREKYNDLLNNKDYLEKIYAQGADKAERAARKTLRKVYKKVGFIPRKFI